MDKKTLLVGLASFLVIGLVAVGVFLFAPTASLRGTTYAEPFPPASEIELTRGDGSNFRLSEMRGNLVLLFFGYTSCPDVCPTTMAELKSVLDQLGADRAQHVKVVFVTVDPKRDTPQKIQEYVNHFNTSFIGLSGSEDELTKIWDAYGIYRLEVPGVSAAGYTVDHTARITLIDRDGYLRASYSFETPVDDIVHDLALLLK